jgi:NhaP-type Na+/H+ or K+/H+ antiporter
MHPENESGPMSRIPSDRAQSALRRRLSFAWRTGVVEYGLPLAAITVLYHETFDPDPGFPFQMRIAWMAAGIAAGMAGGLVAGASMGWMARRLRIPAAERDVTLLSNVCSFVQHRIGRAHLPEMDREAYLRARRDFIWNQGVRGVVPAFLMASILLDLTVTRNDSGPVAFEIFGFLTTAAFMIPAAGAGLAWLDWRSYFGPVPADPPAVAAQP